MKSTNRLFYYYFGYIAFFVFVTIIVGFSYADFMGWEIKWKSIVTLLSILITSAILIQRQKIQETELFHSIFREFNDRYDKINNCLSKIKNSEGSLGDEEKSYLVDYFNICAEEYLFYRRGYIPEEVWRSWRKGMEFYMRDDRIRDFWNEESKTESYYGLEMPNPGKE